MSKYEPLWNYIKDRPENELKLSYEELEKLLGFPIDHSFLSFKKELTEYGWQVGKISMKDRWVSFERSK